MDNNKRTRLRSQAPVIRLVPTVLVPTSKETLSRRSHDIVEVEVEGEHDRGLPIVRNVNKRKRDPRGGGRRQQHKLESEEGSVSVYVDENANSASGDEIKRSERYAGNGSPGKGPFLRPDLDTSSPQLNNTYVIIPEIMPEDQAMMKQLDKRRESSRLRVKPSKFREGFLLGNIKPKGELKGSEDGATSLEIVLPVDTHNSGARSSDNNPKASSSRASESDIDSSWERPSQTSAGNNKFKITYKLGSSKGPERRATPVFSSSAAKKGVDDDELKTALAVVKRVMQIKSAEPFNEPVDPIALEIPDYYDVIAEPMDLGTIRGLLEAGKKYRTAQEVYADVQLVWSNCRSYNQEGDPIMDILRIAETVFNKHWNLASLPVAASSSKPSKAQRMEEEGDEIESSEELAGALEQGRRDKAKRRKAKDAKVAAKIILQKIVHFDTPRTKIKRSASVEQVMAESKAREDKLDVAVTEVPNNDSNVSHEDAADELVEGGQAAEKVEDEEMQILPAEVLETQAEEHAVEHEENPGKGSEVEEEQAEVEKPFDEEVKTPVQEADNAVRGSSSNKRRIFGTVHHKPDCSCVVCVGRRRKLARQEKEGFVDGKKERKHSKSHRAVVNQDNPQGTKSNASRARKPPKLPTDQEAVAVSPGVAVAGEALERDRPDGQMGNASEVEPMVDGGGRYFPATYELPLRKVTPAFLQLSQVLFGKHENTVWRRHHSLGCRFPPSLSTSSMFAAVHSLSLNEK